MDVLLIGGSGSLMTSLINRFSKEGHRVFLLSSRKDGRHRGKNVFECYCFDYASESVPQVFESVRPEAALFLGPWDPGFQVENETQAVGYFSGLVNLLASFSTLRRGRFVYLSTSDIFESGDGTLVTEEARPVCADPRGLVLAQAEEICASYHRNRKLDVVVLRLDQLYAIPRNREEVKQSCGRLCLEALESGSVTWNPSGAFSMLYEADAVEFIHRILSCETHREWIYNISSSVAVTEEQLAGYIAGCGVEPLTVSQTGKSAPGRVLSNKRFNEEFGMRFFSDPRRMAEQTLRYMAEHPGDFRKREEKKPPLGCRTWDAVRRGMGVLVPYIENLICFVPVFMLNSWAAGSRYFDRLDFYLLYVLLFAVIYGQRQATFSAILATAGCFFQRMDTEGSYVWLAQLFAVGLTVGYLRDELREQKRESMEEAAYLCGRVKDISDINRSNVRVKDALRTQIINQDNSVGKIYRVTAALNQYTREEVLFYAAEITAQLMETKDVAIYLVSGPVFARLFSSTSQQARCMGRSIRYRETGEMYRAVSNRQVFINRKLEAGLPMMANAIFEDDRMRVIVMAWGLPWEAMTLGQANLMSVVSALIREAVLRADRYMTALESRRYEKNRQILNREAFSALVEAFFRARSRGLTECALLKYAGEDALSRTEAIRPMLRDTDYLGTLDDGNLYFLLPGAGETDALAVQRRMAENGLEVCVVEEPRL